MKSVNPKSPWLGRTEGPCSDAFQQKISRLKLEKLTPYIITYLYVMPEMLTCEKCCVNTQQMATCPDHVLFRILRRTFETQFFAICD